MVIAIDLILMVHSHILEEFNEAQLIGTNSTMYSTMKIYLIPSV